MALVHMFCQVMVLLTGLAIELTANLFNQYQIMSISNLFNWPLYEWIRDGFPLIFMQYSLSTLAMGRAFKLSLLWPVHGVLPHAPALSCPKRGLRVRQGLRDSL